jgi:flavorubredoxin
MVCPLHGPVWRSDLGWFIDKYDKWSRYEPEDQAVAIIYGSIYGNTEAAANAVATRLSEKGVKNIAVYDASTTHVSQLIAEIFRVSHLVLACPTYNAGLYPPVENLLADMQALAVQKRTVALIENGTWAPTSGKLLTQKLEAMKEMNILEQKLTLKSVLKQNQEEELEAFAQAIVETM